jgi:hypothetical protein
MAKTKLTLNVEDELIQQMKLQAVRDKRSLSDITEELYREFLKRAKVKK